jgi:hypothetical protein
MGHVQKKIKLAAIYHASQALREILAYPLSPNVAYSLKLIVNVVNLHAEGIEQARQSILLSDKTKQEKEVEFLKFLSDTEDTISFVPISKETFLAEEKLKISVSSLEAIELFLE